MAAEKKKNREELLQATEKELDKIVAATSRKASPLKGENNIAVRLGKVINKFNVEKHFIIEIQENSFSSQRNQSKIDAKAVLDGLYIIRTSLDEETLSATDRVKAYKNLSQVEQAFRSYKTIDLKVRPIYHYTAERVKAHIYLCMLSYYVEWHMRELLAPILFDEDDWEAAAGRK